MEYGGVDMLLLSGRVGDITVKDMASVLPLFFIICGVICLICVLVIKAKNAESNDKPVRTAVAKIVDKDQPAANAVTIIGWLLFETEEGERVRVSVKAGHDFLIGDVGDLTWQGTRLISFTRRKI